MVFVADSRWKWCVGEVQNGRDETLSFDGGAVPLRDLTSCVKRYVPPTKISTRGQIRIGDCLGGFLARGVEEAAGAALLFFGASSVLVDVEARRRCVAQDRSNRVEVQRREGEKMVPSLAI